MNAIDRRALVQRHAVTVDGVHADSPLSVGNGEFCFTVDATGLQTFPDAYPLPEREGGTPGTLLGTQSHWAWHSMPGGDDHDLAATRRTYETPRGPVPYVDMRSPISGTDESGASATESWLRANPHRLDLGRIGLVVADGDAHVDPHEVRRPRLSQLRDVRQRLDPWDGIVHSAFELEGYDVEVVTACHPTRDAVAIRIDSPALVAGHLAVHVAFPYGSGSWNVAADWDRDDAHRSSLERSADGWVVDRVLDDTRLHVRLAATPDARVTQIGAHDLCITGSGAPLDVVIEFVDGPPAADVAEAPSCDATLAAAAAHWERFWTDGGAIELAGSSDPRAMELERRIVLSQYQTKIQCAGSLPPQETGLMCNSWRGKFHLEMYWWHGTHFPLWGRPELLERSLGFYDRVLDQARETAEVQGLPGARWPKQVGPDGRESPSPIGTFLVWQQPHPIYLAELLRRVSGEGALERYGQIVTETATFMVALPVRTDRGYELAPPLVPAQESYADQRERTSNPTFELAYWAWALRVAQRWRTLLGEGPEPLWDEVADGLVRPHVRDGVYTAIDVEPYTIREDHPSMAYATGMIAPTHLIDPETLRRTLHDVLGDWDWDSTWGWDFPALAMTAARLGEPSTAVDVLLLDVPKNHYLRNGHNRQTPTLPVYLPGNGGLLTAVAMMAAGWDGADGVDTPGFPDDGTWVVRHEGLHPLP